MEEIQQPNFRQARRELGIDRHWIVILPNDFEELSAHTLLEKFKSEIETINKRAILNFK